MTSNQPQQSKATFKYFPPQVNQRCHNCEEILQQFHSYKESSERQFNTLLEILAEHKVLLDRIVSQNAVISNIMNIFPIRSEEKLKELDVLLSTQADPYIRQIKKLLGGNAERNLHQIFGHAIIMDFNVDGTFGKKRLRDYSNVFGAMIEPQNFMYSSRSPPREITRVTLQPYTENTLDSCANTNLNDILKKVKDVKVDTISLRKQLSLVQGQMKFITEALAENKVLLAKLLKETCEDKPLVQKFPIKTEEQLLELDKEINPENKQQFIKAMRSLLESAGVEKNLRHIVSDDVTMAYNVDGVHGKKSFKRLRNFYGALSEAVSMTKGSNIGPADDHIRKAIRLQKRRTFKNMSVQRNAEFNKPEAE